MGAPQAPCELPLQDSELSKLAERIPASELKQIAVQYLMIPQVVADRTFLECKEKVNNTKEFLHCDSRQSLLVTNSPVRCLST